MTGFVVLSLGFAFWFCTADMKWQFCLEGRWFCDEWAFEIAVAEVDIILFFWSFDCEAFWGEVRDGCFLPIVEHIYQLAGALEERNADAYTCPDDTRNTEA